VPIADAETRSTLQRLGAVILLLAAGVLSLPVAAAFLDEEGNENWIVPAQLAAMALIGAVVGVLLPGLARAGSSKGRSARIGAAVGVAMAVAGVALFFLLINGFDGA
jgi:hypothetical protein